MTIHASGEPAPTGQRYTGNSIFKTLSAYGNEGIKQQIFVSYLSSARYGTRFWKYNLSQNRVFVFTDIIIL